MIKFGIIIIALMFIALIDGCQNITSPPVTTTVPEQTVLNIDTVYSDPIFNLPWNHTISQEQAAQYAQSIIPGDTEQVYMDVYLELPVWVVKLKTNGKCRVTIMISIKFGMIVNMENTNNDKSDDDIKYDFKPINKHLNLNEAIKVSQKHANGKIIKWQLVFNNHHHWIYIIKVKIKSGYLKIYIKAKGGDLIFKTEDKEEDDD